ncbi:MAG: hypothetical protein D8H98_12175 [Prevotella sp.]|nr:MAG: hypothetical protein D8H98_12175 [Prevotella sp.]
MKLENKDYKKLADKIFGQIEEEKTNFFVELDRDGEFIQIEGVAYADIREFEGGSFSHNEREFYNAVAHVEIEVTEVYSGDEDGETKNDFSAERLKPEVEI